MTKVIVCGGSHDMTYQKEVKVPWDTVKKIYKVMAEIAMNEVE